MSKEQFLLLLVAALQFVRVQAFNVVMSPDLVRVDWANHTVSFNCAADSALVGCQYSWWDWGAEYAGPLLDLSLGPQSQANFVHPKFGLTVYSYTGRGLGSGDCGVSLQVRGYKRWIVACRVRAETKGWKYAWAELYAPRLGPIPHNLITPREVIVHPGGFGKFILKAQEPLSVCKFYLPSVFDPIDFTHGATSNHSTGRHLYLGAGLQSGECGLSLTNISEVDNGPLKVTIQAPGEKGEDRPMALIVARPPTAPTLSLTYSFDTVTATCMVGGSRPVANITWFLGNSTIRQDDVDDSPARASDEWRWPWMEASIKQTLPLQRNQQYFWKVLRCQVSHVSLKQPLVAQREIPLTAAVVSCPLLLSTTVDYKCSFNGKEANCSQPQSVGAMAEWRCKPGFEAADDVIPSPLHCRTSGEWDPQNVTCSPGVVAWNVKISPDRMRVRQAPSTVSFTCTADLPLVGCQFRWWDHRYSVAGPLLDLSRGPESQADPTHLDDKLTGYSYTGRGLGDGDCGISLEVKGLKMWMVTCRVRAETGGWKYAWADLYAYNWAPIPHNLTTPREVVIHPGGDGRFMLKAQEPLRECIFRLPNVSGRLNFYDGAASPDSTGRYRYLGAGLQSGECGLELTNISEVDNGPVRVFIHAPGEKDEYRLMALLVAHPPPAPSLNLTYSGKTVTATCVVGESRPVANITWFFDQIIIRQDDVDDSQAIPSDEWRWPWMQASIKQTIKLQLDPQDNGKVLKCQMSYVTLDNVLELQRGYRLQVAG